MQYVTEMIKICAGCRLSNSVVNKSAELVYSFPADEPMNIAHADVYTIGTETSFSGHKNFMFVVCNCSPVCLHFAYRTFLVFEVIFPV